MYRAFPIHAFPIHKPPQLCQDGLHFGNFYSTKKPDYDISEYIITSPLLPLLFLLSGIFFAVPYRRIRSILESFWVIFILQYFRQKKTSGSNCYLTLFSCIETENPHILSLHAAKRHTRDDVLGQKQINKNDRHDCHQDHHVYFPHIAVHIIGASKKRDQNRHGHLVL